MRKVEDVSHSEVVVSSALHRSGKRPRIVLEIHEASQPFTRFPNALADSRTVSRSRGSDVRVGVCARARREERGYVLVYMRGYMYARASLDIDGLPAEALPYPSAL